MTRLRMRIGAAAVATFIAVVAGGAALATAPAARAERVQRVVAAALAQTHTTLRYDGTYTALKYPGGDVPSDRGVCTDVVIRALRAVGVDLQQLVHEDMKAHFAAYPKAWGLIRTDANIDHRRVPNLMTFFTRQGRSLPVTTSARDYEPGDVVTWVLAGGLTHIGLVVDVTAPSEPGRHLIVHNIGHGAKLEDVLFAYPLTGHYRPL